jgi:hypothetical protein
VCNIEIFQASIEKKHTKNGAFWVRAMAPETIGQLEVYGRIPKSTALNVDNHLFLLPDLQ